MSDQPLNDFSRMRAKKALGQHFLFDLNLTRKIAQQAGDLSGRTVFEIGPGPGGLTKALLETSLKRLILIEKDTRFAEDWTQKAGADQRLHVLHADALDVNESDLLASCSESDPAVIVANLPYNVGTPLLVKWLKAGHWRGVMVLMFQLEVAERICAHPGDSAYGRLSIIAQSCADPHLVMKIPASAFTPPPKVESAVVRFDVLPDDKIFKDHRALEIVTAAAFGQRRKMLRQSLKPLAGPTGVSVLELLEQAGLNSTARAETIDVAGFQRLASVFSAASATHISSAKADTPV